MRLDHPHCNTPPTSALMSPTPSPTPLPPGCCFYKI